MVARTYQVASRQLLRQGREELSQGDTRQAAEKGWGAAAQIVKAIAESRGWTHGGHGHLFTTVRDLREETGDEEIGRLFHVANSLHNNFYENNQEAETVREALGDVERFVDKVELLFRQD